MVEHGEVVADVSLSEVAVPVPDTVGRFMADIVTNIIGFMTENKTLSGQGRIQDFRRRQHRGSPSVSTNLYIGIDKHKLKNNLLYFCIYDE